MGTSADGSMKGNQTYLIGSRRSDLARIQSLLVRQALRCACKSSTPSNTEKNSIPEDEVEFQCVFSESPGDRNQEGPMWNMGSVGVFTNYLSKQLIIGDIDLTVHSWKDLPISDENEETYVAATIERDDPRDLLLLKQNNYSKTAKILTSSPRRVYNLKHFLESGVLPFVDYVEFSDVRGNIFTRVRKLLESDSDGLVCAAAAINRLLWAHGSVTNSPGFEEFLFNDDIRVLLRGLHFVYIPLCVSPGAAGQGALAIEARLLPRTITHKEELIGETTFDQRDDRTKLGLDQGTLSGLFFDKDVMLRKLLTAINHSKTFSVVQEEKTILRGYGGGCSQKIGCTILEREYGNIKYLRGLTHSGQNLNESEVLMKIPIDSNSKISGIKPSDSRILLVGGRTPSSDFNCIQLFSRHVHDPLAIAPSIIKYIEDLISSRVHDIGGIKTSPDATLEVLLPINILVTKEIAFPESELLVKFLKKKILQKELRVWTSGLSCWRKLAALGLFISGSSYKMSETDLFDISPNIQLMADEQMGNLTPVSLWLKFTHDETDSIMSQLSHKAKECVYPGTLLSVIPPYRDCLDTEKIYNPARRDRNIVTINIPTYRLRRKYNSLENLLSKESYLTEATHVYWSSSSSFLEMNRLDPSFLSRVKVHGVGPGSTRETVTHCMGDTRQVVVSLDFMEFIDKMVSSKIDVQTQKQF